MHNRTDGASMKMGGLSICLSGTDGRVVGGGVKGPLLAAEPVQVNYGSGVVILFFCLIPVLYYH